jgi:hypothetical protein
MAEILNTSAVAGSLAVPDESRGARHGYAIPSAILILLPDAEFTLSAASDEYLKQTWTVREQVVARSFFDLFPGRPGAAGRRTVDDLRSSLLAVIETRVPQQVDTQLSTVSLQAGRLETYWRHKECPKRLKYMHTANACNVIVECR